MAERASSGRPSQQSRKGAKGAQKASERRKPGRPTKLSIEVQAEVCKQLERGAYPETAAALAGIAKETFYAWLRRGAREVARLADLSEDAEPDPTEAPFVGFSDAIEKALAKAEMRDLNIIASAAMPVLGAGGEVLRPGNWQAAAWRLERRYPEKYGRRSAIEHSGPGGKPIELDVDLAAEARERLTGLLARSAARIAEDAVPPEPD